MNELERNIGKTAGQEMDEKHPGIRDEIEAKYRVNLPVIRQVEKLRDDISSGRRIFRPRDGGGVLMGFDEDNIVITDKGLSEILWSHQVKVFEENKDRRQNKKNSGR